MASRRLQERLLPAPPGSRRRSSSLRAPPPPQLRKERARLVRGTASARASRPGAASLPTPARAGGAASPPQPRGSLGRGVGCSLSPSCSPDSRRIRPSSAGRGRGPVQIFRFPQAPTPAPLSHGKAAPGTPDHPAASPLPGKCARPRTARWGWTRGRLSPRLAPRPAGGATPRPGPPGCPGGVCGPRRSVRAPGGSRAPDQCAASGPPDPLPGCGTGRGPANGAGWGGGSHFPAAREGAAGRRAERASSLPGRPRRRRGTCAPHSPRGPESLPTASLAAMAAQPRRERSPAQRPAVQVSSRPRRRSGRV